ncbi:hypothetical protein IMZ29_18875 [Achromobacter sp. GG226]|uniref:hypothetical protein n=1 Tax=Verticiella alkaliphila TaxID=2779529 RepID=UPI001C0D02D0|nr:hypothetical protein [Verticiella sp. GG226]MBU4612533.1 hypothetical protein [Verticiella sp. GG226]
MDDAKAQGPATAREWLSLTCERPYTWRRAGDLAVPSRRIFVGDPTWGSDAHMEQQGAVSIDSLAVWVLSSGSDPSPYKTDVNGLLWLEANGAVPVAVGHRLDFGVDAACFAVGDVATGQAFTELTDLELDAGRGDSFEWIQPYIQAFPHYARWVSVPPAGLPMFVVSTGNDGGFAAAWLHDAAGALSGILVDIQGRASDRKYLDTLLPARSST